MSSAFRPAATAALRSCPVACTPTGVSAQWLRILPRRLVEVRSGKVELGQGIVDRAGADRRRRARRRPRPRAHGRRPAPHEPRRGRHLGQPVGPGVRHRAALCLRRGARHLSGGRRRSGWACRPTRLAGERRHHRRPPATLRTSYWELADDGAARRARPPPACRRSPAQRASSARRCSALDLAGQGVRPAALRARPRAAGHAARARAAPALARRRAAVARRRQGACAARASSRSCATAASSACVAETRGGRGQGARARCARARPGRERDDAARRGDPRRLAASASRSRRRSSTSATAAAAPDAARTLRARYTRPYLAHASIGAVVRARAVAGRRAAGLDAQPGHLQPARRPGARARARRPRASSSRTSRAPAATATTAPTTSRSTPRCSRARPAGGRCALHWSREDELAWSPFGPAMAVEIEADLDAAGEVVALAPRRLEQRPRHAPGPRGDADAARGRAPRAGPSSACSPSTRRCRRRRRGAQRGAALRLPGAGGSSTTGCSPCRCARRRCASLGAFANVFAIESFVDELARARGEDPVAFRLRHLARSARARRARGGGAARRLGAVAAARGLGPRHRLRALQEHRRLLRRRRRGRGRARDSRAPAGGRRRRRARSINPDGVANQIEGGAIQATSWTLKEAVRFDRLRVTSDTWETYPILRFSEVPAVEVEIVARPEQPSVGAGEAAHGPTAAAIAQRRVRRARRARARSADHARAHHRGVGLSDAPARAERRRGAGRRRRAVGASFKAATGYAIDGTFGAVGAMKREAARRRAGGRADPHARLDRRAGRRGTGGCPGRAPISGVVRTGVAVRAGDPTPDVSDPEALRTALRAAGAIYLPRPAARHGRHPFRARAGDARDRGRDRRTTEHASERRHRNARAGEGDRRASDRLHADHRDPQHAGGHARRAAAARVRAGDGLHGGSLHACCRARCGAAARRAPVSRRRRVAVRVRAGFER